jgi:hypothetical protein
MSPFFRRPIGVWGQDKLVGREKGAGFSNVLVNNRSLQLIFPFGFASALQWRNESFAMRVKPPECNKTHPSNRAGNRAIGARLRSLAAPAPGREPQAR